MANRIEELKELGWGSKEIAELLGQLQAEMEESMPTEVWAENKEPKLEVRISDILTEIGVPAHIMGYPYLKASIAYVINNPEAISAVTKTLYPKVAEQHGSTASRVERAIRHAVEVAWDRGDVETLQKLFGYSVSGFKGKPTNSEFIARVAEIINLRKDLDQ